MLPSDQGSNRQLLTYCYLPPTISNFDRFAFEGGRERPHCLIVTLLACYRRVQSTGLRDMSDRPGTTGAGLNRVEAERIIAILDDTVEKLGFLDRFVSLHGIHLFYTPSL